MKVILYGASGMVGQGVLRECLSDPGVTQVLAVVRTPLTQKHEKLNELLHSDFTTYEGLNLKGYDACLFCLGVSSAGMSEADYHRVTYGYALAAAQALVKDNPAMNFLYISGEGTDSTEKGRSMWARVKGKTENALLALPFKGAYMFRPGFIQPMHGVRSKTGLYRAAYAVLGPLYPVLKAVAPNHLTTSDQVSRAMLKVAQDGHPKKHLETADINVLGQAEG